MKMNRNLHNRLWTLCFGLLSAFLFTGCAHVVDAARGKSGSTVPYHLKAANAAADKADYTIVGEGDKWKYSGKVPDTVHLNRRSTRKFTVTVTKPGYRTVVLNNQMIIDGGGWAGFGGDAAACIFPIFGVTGLVIDYSFGAGRQLGHDTENIVLEPDVAAPPNYVAAPQPTHSPVFIQNQVPPPTVIVQPAPAAPAPQTRVTVQPPEPQPRVNKFVNSQPQP